MPKYTQIKNKTKRRYDPYRPLGLSNKTIEAALKRKYEENRRKNLPNSRQGNGLENGEFGYFIEHGTKIPVLIKVLLGNTMSEIKMKGFNGRIVYWKGSSKSKIERILRKAKSNAGFRPRPITFM